MKTVPSQIKPDENFPTAAGDLINPEFPKVMAPALRFGEKANAEIVLVSDPDADRVGVATKETLASKKLIQLTGNQVGAALTHFILSLRKTKKTLPKNGVVLKTYVTTSLIEDIAKSFNIKVTGDLLVGFKFMGEIIEKMKNKSDFIFAAEESLGYLAGTFVRDKDGAIASMLVAELASMLKAQGKTIYEYLDDLYERFGYYKNILHYIELKGKIGKKKITAIMKGLRAKPPRQLARKKILKIIDRLDIKLRNPKTYLPGKTGDQLSFVLSTDGRFRVTVRPSGTEPTIKCYIQHFSPVEQGSLNRVRRRVDAEAREIEKDIVRICDRFAKRAA